MYMNSSDYSRGDHITDEMWILMPAPSGELSWVEEGLMHGNEPKCGCVAYEAFWEDAHDYSSTCNPNCNYYLHTIANITPDGNSHLYQINEHDLNYTSTDWDVFYDNALVGTSTIQTEAKANKDQVGLEVAMADVTSYCNSSNYCAVPNPTSYAETFANVVQDFTSTNGYWEYWPSASNHVDAGCSNYEVGYCLNGQQVYTYQYNDNDPSA